MKDIKIRKLKASEIEVRVSQINEKSVTLLLYKDARVDQKILDEVFGIYGWQREHQLIGDRLYCTIKIWDEDTKQWVAKQDVGTESNTEKEKGQASDSFKRAGFNIGIGRELYTAPTIRVFSDKVKIEPKKNGGGLTTYDSFEVAEIDYNEEGEINKLKIVNEKTKAVVYEMGKTSKAPTSEAKSAKIDFTDLWGKYKAMSKDELRREYAQVIKNTEYSEKQKKAICDIITKCQEGKE